MRVEVPINCPERFLAHWACVVEGWESFFANKVQSDNPYPPGLPHDAWKYGHLEATDYGS